MYVISILWFPDCTGWDSIARLLRFLGLSFLHSALSQPALSVVPAMHLACCLGCLSSGVGREFLTHLLTRLGSACFAGSWEARLNDADRVEVRGSGLFNTPLPMDLPHIEHASLQQIINHWHLQDTTSALLRPPQFLLIQLNRYIMQSGFPAKLHTCVLLSPGARIQVPCFNGPTLSTDYAVYTPCFTVAHDGLTVSSGHYRCAFFPARGPSYISDDGVPPRCMDRSDISWFESRCYLLCLRRAEQWMLS